MRPRHPAPVTDTVLDALRSWWEHWAEVRALQADMTPAELARLDAFPGDPAVALAVNRRVFAESLRPDTVTFFEQQMAAVLRAAEGLRGKDNPRPTDDVVSVEWARMEVEIRDVVSAVKSLEIHLQPVVSLVDDSHPTLGFEALARFRTDPYRSPDVWCARARSCGLQAEVELSCARAALALMPLLPDSAYLSLNVSPETLGSPYFLRMLDDVATTRLVVEVTEHAIVAEYSALLRAINALRERGLRLAVDDAGAGFASFRHVLELGPEIIKLDIHLTSGIARDSSRQALIGSLSVFADSVGACLVAEGIEADADLLTLRRLGVGAGQGYLFAHPEDPATLLKQPTRRRQRLRAGA
jgi:EAL domain-containing protein (putative c-di-GMP-specific phosphodiesterase class I)